MQGHKTGLTKFTELQSQTEYIWTMATFSLESITSSTARETGKKQICWNSSNVFLNNLSQIGNASENYKKILN